MPERKKKKSQRSSKSRPAKARSTPKVLKAKSGAEASGNNSLPVHDMAGKSIDTLALDPLFTELAVNTDVIYQAVLMYQAGAREGTASTKDRGHVRGGGKKPWKQKGTGQARHGSRRSPLWRGGGTTFGPSPRDYSYSIPSQMRRRAVVEGVKDKVVNKKLFILKDLTIEAPKTKLVARFLDVFKLEKPLILVEQKSNHLLLASRNIQAVSVKTAQEVNGMDVVSHKECVMTQGAYSGLLKRLKS